jgi:hypothetical protein
VTKIKTEAERRAVKTLGVEAEFGDKKILEAQLAKVNEQGRALRERQNELERRISLKLYGHEGHGYYGHHATAKIAEQTEVEMRDLYRHDPIAKKFAEMTEQRTKFLDLVHSDARPKELQAAWQEISGGE